MWTCPPTVEGLGIFWTLDPGGISKHAAESGMKTNDSQPARFAHRLQQSCCVDDTASTVGPIPEVVVRSMPSKNSHSRMASADRLGRWKGEGGGLCTTGASGDGGGGGHEKPKRMAIGLARGGWPGPAARRAYRARAAVAPWQTEPPGG